MSTRVASISHTEHDRLVCPVVATNVTHNAQVLSNLRSLCSFLIGLVAGLVGLESYMGFLLFFSSAVAVEYGLFPTWVRWTTSKQAEGSLSNRLYFDDPKVESFGDANAGESSGTSWRTGALAGWLNSVLPFILTWTLVYGTTS